MYKFCVNIGFPFPLVTTGSRAGGSCGRRPFSLVGGCDFPSGEGELPVVPHGLPRWPLVLAARGVSVIVSVRPCGGLTFGNRENSVLS